MSKAQAVLDAAEKAAEKASRVQQKPALLFLVLVLAILGIYLAHAKSWDPERAGSPTKDAHGPGTVSVLLVE